MTRGYIYHITYDPDNLNTLHTKDFIEYLDRLDVNCATDVDPKQNTAKLFVSKLSTIFPLIVPHPNDTQGTHNETTTPIAWRIPAMPQIELDDARRRYFEPLFFLLKRAIQSLTPTEFEQGDFHEILKLILDPHGDRVYFTDNGDSTFYTINDFIRAMQPNTEYFISGRIIAMKD